MSNSTTTITRTETGGATVTVVPVRPAKRKHKHAQPPASNVHLPAAFTIGAGDRLTPSFVAVPASVAIEVTATSRDGQAHTVVIRTPTRHKLAVPAGGRASVLIPGQRAGRYAIDVDGSARGLLITGVAPGP